jgi:hypothetical protein
MAENKHTEAHLTSALKQVEAGREECLRVSWLQN